MRRALMAASAIAMLAGAQAFGQTVGVGPAETIIIEPEQRTVIRES
jgi:catalase (peroxidase I)